MNGDEDNVVGHHGKGRSSQEDWRSGTEDMQAIAIGNRAGRHVVVSGDQVSAEYDHEGDVQKGPERLCVDLPAMLDDGGKLIHHPAGRVDDEDPLKGRDVQAATMCHGQGIQSHKNDELGDLDNGPYTWHR